MARPQAMINLDQQYSGIEDGLRKEHRIRLNYLEKQMLTKEQFNNANMKLNEEYTLKIHKVRDEYKQQIGRLQQVQDMVQRQRITEQEGFRQMQMVSGMPVPRAEPRERRPFSPSSISTMSRTMQEYTEGFERDPKWHIIRHRKEPRKLQSMLDEYEGWLSENAYDMFTPRQQQQADEVWDSLMRADKRFSAWFSDKEKRKPVAKVSALRELASGRRSIRSIMAKKVGVASPLGRSVTPAQRPQKKRSDPLGLGL